MKRLSHDEMIEILFDLRGSTFTTFDAITEPDVVADCPFKGDLEKASRVNGTINFLYENSVNNRRIREELVPDFEAMPRKWGERINGTPIVQYKEQYYLEVKVERSIEYQYRLHSTGEVLSNEVVSPFLRPRGRSRQGVRQEVILRDYKMGNVLNMLLKGEFYVMR